MSTVLQFLAAIEDRDLSNAVRHCLAWDKTGLLEGEGVQALAAKLGGAVGLGTDWPLDEMSKLLYQEAARRFVVAQKG